MEQNIDLTAAIAALSDRLNVLERVVNQLTAPPKATAPKDSLPFAKMTQYIEDAKRYRQDVRYSSFLAAGFMPASKLLKLSKCPARTFEKDIEAALDAGIIKDVVVVDQSKNKQSVCYVTAKKYEAIKHRETCIADERPDEPLLPWSYKKKIYI